MRARSRSNATCRRSRPRSTPSERARSLRRASSAARNAPAVAYWRGAVIRYLLQNSVEPLSRACTDSRHLQLPPYDQSTAGRLVNGLDQQLLGNGAFGDDIEQCSQSREHRQPSEPLDRPVSHDGASAPPGSPPFGGSREALSCAASPASRPRARAGSAPSRG
jgi:hypothetical protein